MRIEGIVQRWKKDFCGLVVVLPSSCGKALKLSVGTIAPDGEFLLRLPDMIPAYNFLISTDDYCRGLHVNPVCLRIAVVESFMVLDRRNRLKGEIFQASSHDIRTSGQPAEATDWWYATVDASVGGEQFCLPRSAQVHFDLRLQKGWNAVCRRIESAGSERCRVASASASTEWFFRKTGEPA